MALTCRWRGRPQHQKRSFDKLFDDGAYIFDFCRQYAFDCLILQPKKGMLANKPKRGSIDMITEEKYKQYISDFNDNCSGKGIGFAAFFDMVARPYEKRVG